MFEFGPLLAGRDRANYQTGCYPEHTAKFRITNNGLFRAHANFWLKSEGPGADPAHGSAPAETKKKAGEQVQRSRRPLCRQGSSSFVLAGQSASAVARGMHASCCCALQSCFGCQCLQLHPRLQELVRVLHHQPAHSCCTPPAWSWEWRRLWSFQCMPSPQQRAWSRTWSCAGGQAHTTCMHSSAQLLQDCNVLYSL